MWKQMLIYVVNMDNSFMQRMRCVACGPYECSFSNSCLQLLYGMGPEFLDFNKMNGLDGKKRIKRKVFSFGWDQTEIKEGKFFSLPY